MYVDEIDVIAVDHLTAAVIDALSSGYCPMNKMYFLLKLLAAVALLCAAGFGLIAAASRSKSSTRRVVTRIGATALILFALGGAACDLFGLSGCGTHTEAGLIWDWPW